VVARLLGPDVDPYEGVVPQLGMVDVDRLHESLRVSVETLCAALLPAIPLGHFRALATLGDTPSCRTATALASGGFVLLCHRSV
jgi:hypothetical protein